MTPQWSVIRSALMAGLLSLTAGVVLPIFFSTSNLGPLLGILIAGPSGLIAGATWGLVAAARRADADGVNRLTFWLGGVWLATLAYTFFIISLSPKLGWLMIALQALVLAAAAIFLYDKNIGFKLPAAVRRVRLVVLMCAAVVAITTAFPPAKHQAGMSATLISDPRFSAARAVPSLTIAKGILLLEWTVPIVMAAVATAIAHHSTKRLDRLRTQL